ncbi:MAG: class I SAM-dependent methyltransferase, partial [Halobacteria archaeon]
MREDKITRAVRHSNLEPSLKQQIISCYDELARSGRFPDNTFLHRSLLKQIEPKLKSTKSLKILDAGGGAGFFGINLALLGHSVVIMDLSLIALSLALKRSQKQGCSDRVSIVAGDVEQIPFKDESFDAIVCIFVFSHVINPNNAFGELSRVLCRGGQLFVNFENKFWHVVADGLCERYESALSLLSSDFPLIKAYDILPPIRLYSAGEIKKLCYDHNLRINSFTGMRHLASFQEPLKGIGTTDAEMSMHNNQKALELEELLS